MEGPTLSPSYTLMGMKYNALLQQNERNGSDDFLGGDRLEASPATKITVEMQANHYKSDTSYRLDPNGFYVQEADGTTGYLGNYTRLRPTPSPRATPTAWVAAYTSATNYTILHRPTNRAARRSSTPPAPSSPVIRALCPPAPGLRPEPCG